MNETIADIASQVLARARQARRAAEPSGKPAVTLNEHIVEIISDSGEGAQRCGQTFGAIASQMGNGVWTVEIIPAEIRPPARSVAGGSGNRIRHRLQARHQWRQRNRPGHRLQRAGAARPRAHRRTQARLHHSSGKHVAREQGSENRRGLHRDPRPAREGGLQGHRNSDGARVQDHRRRRQARQEHVRARHALQHLQLRPASSAREQIALTFGKKDASVVDAEREAAGGGLRLGREQSRLQVSASRPSAAPSRKSWSTATPRWRSACSPRAWKSAPCTRSRRRRRCRII